MFLPKTDKIKKLVIEHNTVIEQLRTLLIGNVNVYIDYANVRPWSTKLGWNIELKRLKQFLSSFNNISSIKIYDGVLEGDKLSERRGEEMAKIFIDNF